MISRGRVIHKPQPDGTMLKFTEQFTGDELILLLEREKAEYIEIIQLQAQILKQAGERITQLEKESEVLVEVADVAQHLLAYAPRYKAIETTFESLLADLRIAINLANQERGK